jgi:hypothetical protein
MERVPRRVVSSLIVAVALSIGVAAHAQVVDDVYPLEPESDQVVGPKPIFRVGVDGRDLMKMKFRIVLSQDDFDTTSYVFDWTEDAAGWVYTALGDEYGALYRVQKPLGDGEYQWRVDAWSGLDWVEGERTSWVTVDSIPPADVDGLEMEVDRDGAGIKLSWDPVTTDQDGAPEYVTKYHVYRYTRKSFFFVIRPFEIAETEFPRYVDRDPLALDTELVFYKITAEDAAGNEPERRY